MIEILDETKRHLVSDSLLRSIQLFMEELGIGKQELTVVLCNDVLMQQKNLVFRGIDRPTDVLSFPLTEPDDTSMPPINHLGDILVNIEMAQRQSPNQNNTLDQEILVLVSHGLLHLLGYNHSSPALWTEFHRAEELILKIAEEGLL